MISLLFHDSLAKFIFMKIRQRFCMLFISRELMSFPPFAINCFITFSLGFCFIKVYCLLTGEAIVLTNSSVKYICIQIRLYVKFINI